MPTVRRDGREPRPPARDPSTVSPHIRLPSAGIPGEPEYAAIDTALVERGGKRLRLLQEPAGPDFLNRDRTPKGKNRIFAIVLALGIVCILIAGLLFFLRPSGSSGLATTGAAHPVHGQLPKQLTAHRSLQSRAGHVTAFRVISHGRGVPMPQPTWHFPSAGRWVAEALLTISNATPNRVWVLVDVGRVQRRVDIPARASAAIGLSSAEARQSVRVIAGGPVIPQRSLLDSGGGAHPAYGLSGATSR